jgi:hypothetical protein
MMHKQSADGGHIKIESFGLESACDLFQSAVGVVNQINQNKAT